MNDFELELVWPLIMLLFGLTTMATCGFLKSKKEKSLDALKADVELSRNKAALSAWPGNRVPILPPREVLYPPPPAASRISPSTGYARGFIDESQKGKVNELLGLPPKQMTEEAYTREAVNNHDPKKSYIWMEG